MTIATGATWGGIFLTRPYPECFVDAQLIESAGFTILAYDHRAGESVVYAHGLDPAVLGWTTDFEQKYRIRGLFVRYPAGEEITLSGLKQSWPPTSKSVAF